MLFILGCAGNNFSESSLSDFNAADSASNLDKDTSNSADTTWKDIELIDVNSGETFTIGQFDKPVLLESFAVWCPTCTKQQKKLAELHAQVGEDVISISLDTDPNEDVDLIKKHTQSNGFNWRYAISTSALTQQLIDEFGLTFVNAPFAPVVLICPEGSATLLKNGVKSAEFFLEKVGEC